MKSSSTGEELVSTPDKQVKFWIACMSLAALLAASWMDAKNNQERFDGNQLLIQANIDTLTATVSEMAESIIRLEGVVDKNQAVNDVVHDQLASGALE